eukprot:403377168
MDDTKIKQLVEAYIENYHQTHNAKSLDMNSQQQQQQQESTSLNLSGCKITDIEEVYLQYLSDLPQEFIISNLKLNDNIIRFIPQHIQEYLPHLEILNLNNNKLESLHDSIDALSTLTNLRQLFINLSKEEQVDYILKKMPQLDVLNGLEVDRDELYYQSNNSMSSQQQQQQIQSETQRNQYQENYGVQNHIDNQQISQQYQDINSHNGQLNANQIQNSKNLSRNQPNSHQQYEYDEQNQSRSIGIYEGMMTEIRETKKEDFINTQSHHGISQLHDDNGSQILVDHEISPQSLRNTQEVDYENETHQDQQQQLILNFKNQQQPILQQPSNSNFLQKSASQIRQNNNKKSHQNLSINDYNYNEQKQFKDPDLNQVYQNYSRKNSVGGKSSRSHRNNNNSRLDHTGTADDHSMMADEDLINPDEFEEIAEIYDTIRTLHQKLGDPKRDFQLAHDFDSKLKEVMEELSDAVKNEKVCKEVKQERSLSSKHELYHVCAEKIAEYVKERSLRGDSNYQSSPSKRGKLTVPNVISAVFDGMRGVYLDLQEVFIHSISQSEQLKQEFAKCKEETFQLLKAAQHLESQNNYNHEQVGILIAEKEDMQSYLQKIEQENSRLKEQLQNMNKAKDKLKLNNQNISDNHSQQQQDSNKIYSQSPLTQRESQSSQLQQNMNSIQNNSGSISSRIPQQINQMFQFQQQQQSQSPNRRSYVKPFMQKTPQGSVNQSVSQRESSRKKNLINATINAAHNKQNSIGGGSYSPLTSKKSNISTPGAGMILSQQTTNMHQRNISEQTSSSLGGPANNSLYQAFQNGFKKKMNAKGGLGSLLGSSQTRTLTLKQIKDLITDIYSCKTKFDQKCQDSHQPRETMEQYMYTYLNQRYGLKNLIIEWAAAIIQGIKTYSKDDHEVALFGKILRNECDEEFRFIQATVKDTVYALLKAILKEKYPSKSEDAINQMMEAITGQNNQGVIETWQWKRIIEKMYDDDDYQQLENQLVYRMNLQQQQNLQSDIGSNDINKSASNNNSNNILANAMKAGMKTKMTRNQRQLIESQSNKEKLKFSTFIKTVLDFQLKEHEKFLQKFILEFKHQDRDNDGVLNEQQFKSLIQTFGLPQERINKFLQVIDPYNNEKITFSEIVNLLSQENWINQETGQEMAILEIIANM